MAPKKETIITKKLGVGYIILTLLFISFGIHHLYQTNLFSNLTSSIYNHPLVVSNEALQANAHIVEMHRSMKDVALLDSNATITEAIVKIYEGEREVLKHLDIVSQKILGEEGKALEKTTRKLLIEWRGIWHEIIQFARAGQREKAAKITMGKSADHVVQLEGKMMELVAYARGKATYFMKNAESVHSRITAFTAIYIITGVLFSAFIAFITLKKVLQAEKKALANLTLLQGVIEGVDDPILVKNLQKHWLLANSSTGNVIGKKPKELIGKTTDDIFTGKLAQKINETDSHVFNTGEMISYEQDLKVQNALRTYLTKKTALKDSNDQIIGVISVARDITERKKILDELERELIVNSALSALYEPLTLPGATLNDITDKILEQALNMTASEFGYVSSIDINNGDLIGHTLSRMLGDQCKLTTTKPNIVFKCGEGGIYKGLWGYSLNTKKPFFTNSPDTHEASTGLPGGHIPVTKFLSVPVYTGTELIGQISLANKKEDYTPLDLDAINRLAAYFAMALQRKRAEEQLLRHQEELEKRVEERTEELVKINEKLAQEISEKQIQAMALRESEQKYSMLVDNAIVGIMIIQDASIVYANTRIHEIFGYSINELTNIDPNALFHSDNRSDFEQRLAKSINGRGDRIENIHKGITKDMKIRWIDIRETTISFNGKPAILWNVVDITRRKELEYLINIQDKMTSLGRVAAGIAHELRNPLSGINLHLTNLERLCQRFDSIETDTQKNMNRIIDNLKVASNKIESVVKRVYDFSKPSMYNLDQVDVNKSIINVIEISAVALRKKSVTIEKRLESNIPPCSANKNLFEQLILNLITNASQILDTVDGKKKILITSNFKDNNIIIKLADSGPGVPETLRDKIFDPFFTGRKDGLGIGLSICYRIVKDHGGELTLEMSDELGGAEFIITLPIEIKRNN